jgi:hypothetical protein
MADLFSSFNVLGDSLSGNGNTATMVAGANAQQSDPIDLPYPFPRQQLRVSPDGFTWAKGFTDAVAAAGKATANLSFGAARASDTGDGPPDLTDQTAAPETFTTSFSFTLDPNPRETKSGTVPKYPGLGDLLAREDKSGANPLVTVYSVETISSMRQRKSRKVAPRPPSCHR